MLGLKDVLELKVRIKAKECSFTRMRGCYVDSDKNKVTHINEVFINLEDDEYYKYLNIARTVLSKKIDDRMLSMEFTDDEKECGDMKYLLTNAVRSELKDKDIVNALYDRIIDRFQYTGKYLILLYSDIYDVPRLGKDGADQDESEEVYAYILCAICPVTLTEPGLEYNPKSNQIATRERDLVVQKPVVGFLYPSFEERTAEADKVMFYTASAENPPHDFMELGLGCMPVETKTEIRNKFEHIFFNVTGDKDLKNDLVIAVNGKLNVMANESKNANQILSISELGDICQAAGIPDGLRQEIVKEYAKEFSAAPKITHLLNSKAVKAAENKEKNRKIADMMKEAVAVIETSAGEETELTYNMKNVIGQYR